MISMTMENARFARNDIVFKPMTANRWADLGSPALKPIDDQSVWSIVCFFVSKPYRKSGLTHLLVRAAIDHAKGHGAWIVEAYPIDVRAKYIEYERYSGLTTTYEKEGFKVACRHSERRPIMRYYVE